MSALEDLPQTRFFVPGRPIPGDTSSERHEWIATVTKAATRALRQITARPPLFRPGVPVECHLEFVMPRTNKMPKKKPTPDHLVRPAVDTLERPVMRALTNSGIWGDDAQVISGYRSKRYAEPSEQPGVHITLSTRKGADTL